jgi:hemerythrin
VKRHRALIPLSHDHHHTLSMTRRLRRAAQARPAVQLEETHAFLDHFDAACETHFDEEEQLVLPLLAANHPLAVRTSAEHARIRKLVSLIRTDANNGRIDAQRTIELADLLQAHIRFEERELFEAAQRDATPEALDRLAEQLAARSTGLPAA